MGQRSASVRSGEDMGILYWVMFFYLKGGAPPLQFLYDFFERDEFVFFFLARLQFYHPILKRLFPNRHADRATDQICVVEFDACAFVSVIE